MLVQQPFGILIFAIVLCNLINGFDLKPAESATTNDADNGRLAVTEDKSAKQSSDVSEYRAKYAQKMLSYMNQTVDPCDDFYEYACGNWKNTIEERPTEHKRDNAHEIQYTLLDIIEKLLQQGGDPQLEQEYASELKLTRQYYNACLAAELYPIKRSQTYLDVINAIGGFPAVDALWQTHSAANFSWFNMTAHLTNYGVFSLVNEEIVSLYPFPTSFKQPELGFGYVVHSNNIASNSSRVYRLNERRMRKYLTTYNVDEKQIPGIIEDIFELWRAILAVSDQYGGEFDICMMIDTDAEFKQWPSYFEIAWSGVDYNRATLDLGCEHFYSKLDAICETRKAAVANYLAMKFLNHMDAHLKHTKFQKQYCLKQSMTTFQYLMDKLYMAEQYNSKIHAEVNTIITELRKSLVALIQQADWLDELSRTQVLRKESVISSSIGRHEEPALEQLLVRAINNLTFVAGDAGSYELNNIALRKFDVFMKRYSSRFHEQLNDTTQPQELLVGMTINAFNYRNSINVYAGILHPPIYHWAWPYALKFGGLGNTVGHELTHSFESITAPYYDNIDGVYRTWKVSKKSSEVFSERSACFVDSYNSFVIPEVNRTIDGQKTKSENVADSGGIRQSLNAYRRYMKELSKERPSIFEEEQMPGLNLSNEQTFFLGLAQVFCAAYKEEHYWQEFTDGHTINKYRVLGAMINYDEFAKVYECPLGSKMNPREERCRLW